MAESPDDARAVLKAKEQDAQERLRVLSNRLASAESLAGIENLCIYATGSFGRLEASEHSDLDLFFVQTANAGATLGRIDKTLLDADVIRAARELGFPEFSRDGLFLEVHQLTEILSQMGGQEDDFRNYFTARLLPFSKAGRYSERTFTRALSRESLKRTTATIRTMKRTFDQSSSRTTS